MHICWLPCTNTSNPSVAFRERDVVLISSHSQPRISTASVLWTNMQDCVSKGLNIELEYPSSAYLFRCLKCPGGDPIAAIIATATLITTSSRLEAISRFFRDVSGALNGVNTSKAAQLLRPLQAKPIFPITNGAGEREYDTLLDLHHTGWFIADRPPIRESMHGKLPLLALPVSDLPSLEDLIRVLRLDARLLSEQVTCRTEPKGRISTHWAYTNSLRERSPFMKA